MSPPRGKATSGSAYRLPGAHCTFNPNWNPVPPCGVPEIQVPSTPAHQGNHTGAIETPPTPVKNLDQSDIPQQHSALIGGLCFDDTNNTWMTCYECEADGSIDGPGALYDKLRETAQPQSGKPDAISVSRMHNTFDVRTCFIDKYPPAAETDRVDYSRSSLSTS